MADADDSANTALEINEQTKNLLFKLLRASSSGQAEAILSAATDSHAGVVNEKEDLTTKSAWVDALAKGTNCALGTDTCTRAHARRMRGENLKKSIYCEQETRRTTPPSAGAPACLQQGPKIRFPSPSKCQRSPPPPTFFAQIRLWVRMQLHVVEMCKVLSVEWLPAHRIFRILNATPPVCRCTHLQVHTCCQVVSVRKQNQVKRVDSQHTVKKTDHVCLVARQQDDARVRAQVPSQMSPTNAVFSVPAISNGISYARMDLQARADAVGEAVRPRVSRRHAPSKRVVPGVSRGKRLGRLWEASCVSLFDGIDSGARKPGSLLLEHTLQVVKVRQRASGAILGLNPEP